MSLSTNSTCPMVGLAAFAAVMAGVLARNKLCCQEKGKCCGGGKPDTNDEAYKNIQDLNLPVIDMNKFFNKDSDRAGYEAECQNLAECLHLYGAALVKDPRFKQEENCAFLDMMEKYFELSDGARGIACLFPILNASSDEQQHPCIPLSLFTFLPLLIINIITTIIIRCSP